MIRLLASILISKKDAYEDPRVRNAYGMLCGALGIALNLLLFAGKFTAGLLSSSVAITADAFNNLSDAASSIVMLFGFRLAAQKPDSDHPFGHGRFEYISGLVVSFLILWMALELCKQSIGKILRPTPPVYSGIVLLILCASLLVKCYMAYYNYTIGQKIDSVALRVTATDSLGDLVATSAVLGSLLLYRFKGIDADGYCGFLVAIFIFLAGVRAARDTISPLLGQAPDPAFVSAVREIVLSHDLILGVHDLVVHNYGPGRTHLSLHAEVPADRSLVEVHDLVDEIERKLHDTLRCNAVIHMDPVSVNDPETDAFEWEIRRLLAEIDPALSIHDLHIVKDADHNKLLFDVAAPFDFPLSDNALTEVLSYKLHRAFPADTSVIIIDRV